MPTKRVRSWVANATPKEVDKPSAWGFELTSRVVSSPRRTSLMSGAPSKKARIDVGTEIPSATMRQPKCFTK